MPRPGSGAADWVLAEIAEISAKLDARNTQIADEANGGRNARDATAHDDNLAVRETMEMVAGIQREALARARAEATIEPIATESPRG